jgi:catechol 2,3-dioxygenase-like lactoylglutathione lyase family enzyme
VRRDHRDLRPALRLALPPLGDALIDHIIIGGRDLAVSKAFYERALAPLDYEVLLELPGFVGLGRAGKPDFFLREQAPGEPLHVAFRAADRGVVDAFYEAALAAGGSDNGPPGVREIYHPTYYGAYVLDPDGHNVEAVCHDAVEGEPTLPA